MKTIRSVDCSALSRVMVCAGSLFFENLPRSESDEKAKEGSAAGEYLERLLTSQDLPSHARNNVAFSDEMIFYASSTYNDVMKDAYSIVLCERVIDWQTRSGIWIKGRYDISFTDKDGKLYVDDFKYGYRLVDVKENWQLLAYAIGEILRQGSAYETIVLRIHQPRPHHEDGPIRSWELSYNELLDYKEQIENRMDQIASGYSQLSTSGKCKYCPAAASACPAFNRAVFYGVDYVLDDFKQDSINESEIAFQLELLERVTDIMKIKLDSLSQLAVNRINEGKIIPGYVCEQQFSNRHWKSDVTPEVIETLTGKNIIEKTMLSPAKAEKIGVPKDLVKELVDRHFTGVKLKRKSHAELANQIFGVRQ